MASLQAQQIAIALFHLDGNVGVEFVPAQTTAGDFRQLQETGGKRARLFQAYKPAQALCNLLRHRRP
ncbi:hypothetical protein PPNSA23_41060 [Phyllobacterium phragmitis]|uniref:Uncharacterized protein n=1 Tax=Phyllobacterium phragmitis TaxID=2670329 RepID=A0ABQ0H5F0_9HYPH